MPNETKQRNLHTQSKALEAQAAALDERARALEEEPHALRMRAKELREKAAEARDAMRTDNERAADHELDEMHAAGKAWHGRDVKGYWIEAGGRRSYIGSSRFGCCLDRLYARLRDPAYIPKDGDTVPCSLICRDRSGPDLGFFFKDGRWWHTDWPPETVAASRHGISRLNTLLPRASGRAPRPGERNAQNKRS